MNRDQFYLRISRSLSGCQLVEQGLKLYISEALQLVVKRLDGQLPFKMSGEDYEDLPMGRLIQVFTKLSDEPALVTALNAFKKQRDFLSHRAITECIDPGGDFSDGAAAALEPTLAQMEKEAERLCLAIHDSANKFRGNLYFDPITVDQQ